MRLVEFGGSDDLLNMNIFSGWRKLSKLMRSMELTEQEVGRSLVIKPLSDIDVTVGKTAGTPVTNHVIIVGTNGIQLSLKSPPKRIHMSDELFLIFENISFAR